MYRSMLYVPASNQRFIARAAERHADAIILDLEDSVAPSQKARARDALAESVPTCAAGGAAVFVRVNRPLREAVADVEAATRAGARGILLAKTANAAHVRLMAEVAGDCEAEFRQQQPLEMIVVLEGPASVLAAAEIAASDPRVIGTLVGGEDLATTLDAMPSAETLRLPKLLVHMAAKAAGRYSFGTLGTVADYRDHELIRSLATEAHRHGFDGATCVHPDAVPLLNEGFTPTLEEIERAQALIGAFEKHVAAGTGAFSFEGQMVDEPVVKRARRLLERLKIGG